jgi:hypothetical protein
VQDLQITISANQECIFCVTSRFSWRQIFLILKNSHTHIHKIDTEHNRYAEVINMREEDAKKKNCFLYVVSYDTSTIKDGLVKLKDLIDKYNGDPKPEKWDRVKEYSNSESKRLEEIRKYIFRHLDIVRSLVKNHRLDPGKFDYVYIKYSVDLFYDAHYMDPQYDQPGLEDLTSDIEDQIAQIQAALQFVEAEKAT